VLLYGGIYTINAIADFKSDKDHPLKRRRPLPAREIGLMSAAVFSLVLITGGLLTGFLLFNVFVFYIYLAFLAVNAFYSLVAKEIPYFELFVNAATHPLRFIMGVLLVNGDVPQTLLLAIFILAFGLVTVRRCIEKDVKGWEARKVLKVYPNRMLLGLRLLAFSAIILILIVDTTIPSVFYWCMLAVYFVLVFGVDFWAPMRRIFVGLWTT
jgi:4-hydroxybenzoate polyprenyltransferase